MNYEVLILFINATIIPVISSIVVISIFRKQYLPTIKRLEREEKELSERQNV